jgi:hypothetical protein
MIATKREPPETEPETLPQVIVNHLTVPKLRDYFLSHWDWYTLQTIALQTSPSTLDEAAMPHVIAMRDITTQCSRVLMQRFAYSAEKSVKIVEIWLDTGYDIPDNN